MWPHDIGWESQADEYVWVLWSFFVTWMKYSSFSENDLLTPVTPKDPTIFKPITFVEGVQLMHVNESYGILCNMDEI